MDKKILYLAMVLLVSFCAFADPLGSNIINGGSSRRPDPMATNITAQGGNTSFITADLSQISTVWQGFFGTVTGGISLENGDGSRFYDWNVVEAVGEVVATRNMISDWSNIECSNQTEIYLEELELNIQNESSDGVNDTFTNFSHPPIAIAGRELSGCRSTRTNNETTANAVFWNVLLNTDLDNIAYTAIMEDDVIGFNGTPVDFQLLVPVDRLTGQSTYIIYVELD